MATSIEREDAGYQKSLKPRQIQMIAIGGAIGSGLFLGAGQELKDAGPMLFVVFTVCGLVVFLVLRALGELIVHRPTTGSFVSYSRELLGEKAAFAAGWMYFLNWALAGIVDATAIATYMHFWSSTSSVPQWLWALIALAIVFTLNLISVKLFGEVEFWASLIKVSALIIFLAVGAVYVLGGFEVDGKQAGFSMIANDNGLFPAGYLPLLLVIVGALFAYAGSELVGIAAGEAENPEKVMPKAVNSVVFRIAIFYIGSLLLLALLVPYSDFSADTSPFVTFFERIGVDGAAGIMNFIVITAAFSSLNSGLYSTGRILRSLAVSGSAPRFTAKMSGRGIPYGGIALTGVFAAIGVFINLADPGQAFQIVLNLSALGVISSWSMIVICQIALYRKSERGLLERPSFRMMGAPWTGYLTLAFLLGVAVIMGFDYPIGTWTLASLVFVIPALVGGWFLVRNPVH